MLDTDSSPGWPREIWHAFATPVLWIPAGAAALTLVLPHSAAAQAKAQAAVKLLADRAAWARAGPLAKPQWDGDAMKVGQLRVEGVVTIEASHFLFGES